MQALEDLAEFWENKLLEKASLLDNAHEEKREQGKEFQEVRRQVEEDADRELLGMKNKYERRLKDEKEASIRLSGENGILRKKCKGLEVRSAALPAQSGLICLPGRTEGPEAHPRGDGG